MAGGQGNDRYIVDNAGANIVEAVGEGTDEVQSSISFALSANVENLVLTGSANITGTGNALDNILTGNAGLDVLNGGAGNDTYIINNSGHVIQEASGGGTDLVQSSVNYTLGSEVENLTLTGTAISGTGNALDNVITGDAANNILSGGAGNDTIDGSTGADTLVGGVGDDTYVIRNYEGGNSILLQSIPGDYIGAGQTLSMFPQPGEIPSLSLGDRNHDGLIDTLHFLYIGTGHFWDMNFSAPLGTNLLPGNYTDAQDIYSGSPDHPGLNISGDGRGGSSVFGNFTVSDFTVDYSGFAPVLDHLSISFEQHSGSATAPPLFGTLTYDKDAATAVLTYDTLLENPGEGTDTVQAWVNATLPSNVENLFLNGTLNLNGTGNASDNSISGNSGSNILDGGAGADTLNGGAGNNTLMGSAGDDSLIGGIQDDRLVGGAGNDTLVGGAGQDVFAFASLNDLSASGDHVVDLDQTDRIDLSNIGGLHFVGSAAFSGTAGEFRYSSSGSTTLIQIDANGDAVADRAIVLDNGAFFLSESSAGSNILAGVPLVNIETFGTTILAKGANHFYLRDSNGAGPALSSNGVNVMAGQYGAWTPIGAEKTGSGYEIAWKNGSADQYTLWATDANGNFAGNIIGNVPGSDATLQSAETLFQQDLNGDGRVGPPPFIVIENHGATTLATAGSRFYLQDSNGAGPVLSSGGANILTGQYGAWTPIGAEKTDSGYEVAWKNGSADQYTLWAVDANGNFVSNIVGNVPGSDTTLQAAEVLFQQDFNNDGHIGSALNTSLGNLIHVTLDDPGALYTAQATQITNDAIAALTMWLPNLAPTVGSLDVNITITNATGANVLADTVAVLSQFAGVDNGINVFAPGFAFEFASGIDTNGNSPDLQIRINPDHLATDLWIDPLNGSPLPQNKVDLIDVLAHELAHGFAFTGLRNRSDGTLSGSFESTFDRYITFVNSVPYFTGPHAEAVYGGPVPLTINSLYHVGNLAPAPGSDIAADLMYRTAHFGRTPISSLDVAILSDCGVPTILSDMLVGSPGNDTMNGGTGDDTIEGSAGDDSLTGGAGADDFLFASLNDLSANADHISDFDNTDVIDLSSIGGLHFIGGTVFSGSAGEVRYVTIGQTTSVLIDADGDGVSDRSIVIDNGAFALAETSAGSHVLSAAPPVVVTTFIESIGATKLGTANNRFYLQDSNGSGPILSAGGANVLAGQYGAWTPIGAEKTGSGGYEIAWKNGSADQYTLWAADANGNFTGNVIGTVPGADATLQTAELLFQQDLNNDGRVGLPTVTVIESLGATTLATANNRFYLQDSGGNGPVLSSGGANVLAGQFGAWTPIAAEKTDSGGYEIAWKNGSADQFTLWAADANGNFTGNVIGTVAGADATLQTAELLFQQDLNGDGRLGLPTVTVIESHGATTLATANNRFYLQDSGGNGPALSTGGANVLAGQYGAWTPIAAEKTGSGGYEIAWKNGSADQYTLWAADANGNFTGNVIGTVPGADATLQAAELLFQQDLNGDGRVGLASLTIIESLGATTLATGNNRFYLQDSGGNGPALSAGGANVLAGQYGAWTPIAAEKTGSGGYEIAWKNGSADQYTLWAADANGNFTGNVIGTVPGSDATLETAELLFQQDLNNDGHFGLF